MKNITHKKYINSPINDLTSTVSVSFAKFLVPPRAPEAPEAEGSEMLVWTMAPADSVSATPAVDPAI